MNWIDLPAGSPKVVQQFFLPIGVFDRVCRNNKADLPIDIKIGARARACDALARYFRRVSWELNLIEAFTRCGNILNLSVREGCNNI